MTEKIDKPSISKEGLCGSVQVITEQELRELRARFSGEKFDSDLLSIGHDSQAGGWVSYDGTLLFFEADNPAFDIVQATKTLLGLI